MWHWLVAGGGVVWHWLVTEGHVYQALVAAVVGWTVGVVMTGVVIGLIVKPMLRSARQEWDEHLRVQQQLIARLAPPLRVVPPPK